MNDARQLIGSVLTEKAAGKEKNRIFLVRENSGYREAFDILYGEEGTKCVRAGSSCVCYHAVMPHEGNRSGLLKEFYPCSSDRENIFFLQRREDNSLCVSEGIRSAARKFLQARESFLESYRYLRETMEAVPEMKSFIPEFTIYRSCAPDGSVMENGTVYIWTNNEPMETFDRFLENVRARPSAPPAKTLSVILHAILNLTECIGMMHRAGLLHLDIKPSNFGFRMRGDKPLLDAICLFDINSFVSSAGSRKQIPFAGTEGYSAGEISIKPNVKSDIYSIGATLFEAVAVYRDPKSKGFRREYYTKIPEFVRQSPLVAAMPHPGREQLEDILTRILTGCLGDFDHRRPDARELTELLKKAVACLPAPTLEENRLPDPVWDETDEDRRREERLILLQHLFAHPLYACCRRPDDSAASLAKKQKMNILLLGFGHYGQQFLDAALPLSVMYHTDAVFHVVSDNIHVCSDREIYMRNRPGLRAFVNLQEETEPDRYARIRFADFHYEPEEEDAFLAFCRACEPDYVFVAMGESALNLHLADILQTEKCSVNFVWEGTENDTIPAAGSANPVFVHGLAAQDPCRRQIEQMAYNCHMLWNRSRNEDPGTVRRKFIGDKNNYYASIASAAAVPYKLAGLGISTEDPVRAAAQYTELLRRMPDVREEMIVCEHRRWVLDKAAGDRYTCLQDPEEAVQLGIRTGSIHDRQNRRHVCLVDAAPSMPLSRIRNWDEEIPAALDPLDTVSVELHRAFRRQAQQIREKEPPAGDAVKQIRRLIRNHAGAERAFAEWYRIMTLIWNGNRLYSSRYEDLKTQFERQIGSLPAVEQKELKAQTAILHDSFYPLWKSLVHTDFKQNDAANVDRIPFVLTYPSHENLHIAVPLLTGGPGTVFGNAAQAILLNPWKITYLYRVEDPAEIGPVREAMEFVCRMIDRKHLQTRVNLLLACPPALYETVCTLDGLQQTHKRIVNVRTVPCRREETADRLYETLAKRQCRVTAVERNETYDRLFSDADRIAAWPSYRLDPCSRRFREVSGCAFLSYADTDRHLSVHDLWGEADRTADRQNDLFPAYGYVYRQVYRQNKEAWRYLCGALAAHTARQDTLAFFPSGDRTGGEPAVEKYILPAFACEAVKDILARLQEAAVVTENSSLRFYSTDAVQVTLETDPGYLAGCRELFADPYRLCHAPSLVYAGEADGFRVSMNSLVIRDFCPERYGDAVRRILQSLEEKRLIGHLTAVPCGGTFRFGFVCASHRMKTMLVQEKAALELYCYAQLVDCPAFYDVEWSAEPSWEACSGTAYGLVITRGFRILFAECITDAGRMEEACARLHRRRSAFGNQAAAVLLTDVPMQDIAGQPWEETYGVCILSADTDFRETLQKMLENTPESR